MAAIAGIKTIKSSTGKITHVTLSMKHHGKLLEDLIDSAEMDKARSGPSITWAEAEEKLKKKFKLKD